jgi:hypothetical protein
MQHFKLSDLKNNTSKEVKGLFKRSLKYGKNSKGENIICDCGSTSFYLASIVHIRCSKCNKPL